MRILVAFISVFMVSGAVAQVDFDGNDFGVVQEKKPAGYTAGVNWPCNLIGEEERRPTFQCKDPRTGKTQEVQCKTPPKQKLPPKLSMTALDEICGYVTGDGSDQLQ